ncbi:MAG: hypothetical protein LBK76_09835 [Verrucomicrobiales bacterium]|nr:hypothetical protein [Verrucomicrobiales bacterium]
MNEIVNIVELANTGSKPCWLIIGALIALGYILKYVVRDGGDNRAIPLILGAVSLLTTPLLVGAQQGYSLAGVVASVLLSLIYTAAAWMLHGLVIHRVEKFLAEKFLAEKFRDGSSGDSGNGQWPQTPLTVLALALTLTLSGCATVNRPLDPTATVEQALPYIKVGATLAMGAGLKYGVSDPAQREAIANLSWSVSHAVWTLTDGQVPTVASLTTYLQSFDYELQGEAANAYDAMIGAIAALYGGYYADLRGNPALAVKVLSAIAEGAAAGSAAYATTGQQP